MKTKTKYQHLWYTAKPELRRKFILTNSYIKKEWPQIFKLTLHLNELEQEELIKPQISRRKEVIKIGVEINAIENRKKKKVKTI